MFTMFIMCRLVLEVLNIQLNKLISDLMMSLRSVMTLHPKGIAMPNFIQIIDDYCYVKL